MTNIKKNLKSHIGPTKKTSALIKYLKTVLKQGGKKIDYFLSGKIKIFWYRKWSRQTFKDASIYALWSYMYCISVLVINSVMSECIRHLQNIHAHRDLVTRNILIYSATELYHISQFTKVTKQ